MKRRGEERRTAHINIFLIKITININTHTLLNFMLCIVSFIEKSFIHTEIRLFFVNVIIVNKRVQ